MSDEASVLGAARLRERVLNSVDNYVLRFDDSGELAGIEARKRLLAALDAYAAYERQRERLAMVKHIRGAMEEGHLIDFLTDVEDEAFEELSEAENG